MTATTRTKSEKIVICIILTAESGFKQNVKNLMTNLIAGIKIKVYIMMMIIQLQHSLSVAAVLISTEHHELWTLDKSKLATERPCEKSIIP